MKKFKNKGLYFSPGLAKLLLYQVALFEKS